VTSEGYVFVVLADYTTLEEVAVRVDQIVAIVPTGKGSTIVALLDVDSVIVSETTRQVLDRMTKAIDPLAEYR
jgi:hypothetical protein